MVFRPSPVRYSSRCAFFLYPCKVEFSERNRAISFSRSSLLAFAFSSAAWAINSGTGSCFAVCFPLCCPITLAEFPANHTSVSLSFRLYTRKCQKPPTETPPEACHITCFRSRNRTRRDLCSILIQSVLLFCHMSIV